MTLQDISHIRLHSQQITKTEHKTVKEIVSWMGAMQAQDYAMSKWAIGARLPNATDNMIEKAFNEGEILRTHVMRPTWHLVSADDIYWMLELTAPRIKAITKVRDIALGIDESIYAKTNAILESSLSGGKHLTSDELKVLFANEKIDTDENRFYHYMMKAEIDAIVCSGAIKNKKQSYALLSERVPKAQRFTRDESLAKLAERYFASHGPATLQDFVWWSGLTTTEARKGLEMVKHLFVFENIDSETYWFKDTKNKAPIKESDICLLPAFDEYLISYKNRNAIIANEHQRFAFSTNGIFRPIIVLNGKTSGIWKRTIKKEVVEIETTIFENDLHKHYATIEQQYEAYGKYLGKKILLKNRS